MFVYAKGEKALKQASYLMSICPAKHLEGKGEMPSDWVDSANKPIEFNVEFIHGRAEVPDSIGKYMIQYGFANKSRLIIRDALVAA